MSVEPMKPWLDCQRAAALIKECFGFTAASVTELESYDDRNFKVQLCREDCEWERYPHGFVLKVVNWIESRQTEFIESTSRLLVELSEEVTCQRPVLTRDGRYFATERFPIGAADSPSEKVCAVRLFTFLPGRTVGRQPLSDRVCLSWGALLGRLHRVLHAKGPGKYPALLSRYTPWSLWSVPQLSALVDDVVDSLEDRKLVHSVLSRFAEVEPTLRSLPVGILHGDLNEKNVLTRPVGNCGGADGEQGCGGDEVYAVLDWGDVHGGPRVLDLAVMLAYVLIAPVGRRSPDESVGLAIAGYLRHLPEERGSVSLLKTLVAARLCQSLVMGLHTYRQNPGNEYVLETQENGWRGLRRLWSISGEELQATWDRVLAEQGALLDGGSSHPRHPAVDVPVGAAASYAEK